MMSAEDDMLAAELALGVLEGDERGEALRRQLADPAFAAEVEIWRERFARMFAEWPEAVPADDVEGRVMGELMGAANDPAPSRRGWAWATGAITLVAACLVLALALRPERIVTIPAPAPTAAMARMVAALAPTPDGDDVKPFAASYDPNTGEVRLAGGVDVAAGRSAELWVIAKDQPPHSLGVFAGDQARVTIGGANLARMAPGSTLAVSIEPEGGSPTGAPTGPVVATGVLSAV
jgi:anti-sigma-K factor RskA